MIDESKYTPMACKLCIVVFSAIFGCILNALALATKVTWIYFIAVPAGVLDLAILVSLFKILYRLGKGEDL